MRAKWHLQGRTKVADDDADRTLPLLVNLLST